MDTRIVAKVTPGEYDKQTMRGRAIQATLLLPGVVVYLARMPTPIARALNGGRGWRRGAGLIAAF